MILDKDKLPVALCDQEPMNAEGLRSVLAGTQSLELRDAVRTLEEAALLLRTTAPAILVLDKSFGTTRILEFLAFNYHAQRTRIIVWGASISDGEAIRFMNAGAQGVVSKSAEIGLLLSCLESVGAGTSWMENTLFRSRVPRENASSKSLTAREQEVLEFVEQGMRNKEIATQLGISVGTVKIHLGRIFEKTGLRSRYRLALSGWQAQVLPGM